MRRPWRIVLVKSAKDYVFINLLLLTIIGNVPIVKRRSFIANSIQPLGWCVRKLCLSLRNGALDVAPRIDIVSPHPLKRRIASELNMVWIVDPGLPREELKTILLGVISLTEPIGEALIDIRGTAELMPRGSGL